MAIDRTTLMGGPARITFNNQVFFSQGAVEISFESETSPTQTEKWGKVDEVILEPVYRVRFTPCGEWEALSTLFPLSKLALGASILGAADKSLRILDGDGRQWYFHNAAITQEPSIQFSAETTLLGPIEFTCLRENNQAWSATDVIVEVTDGETVPADTEFSLAQVLRQGYDAAWGATSPWDDFDTEDGITLTPRPTLTFLKTDQNGRVDIRLSAYEVEASFIPVGPASSDVDAALLHQGSGAARAVSLPTEGNLVVSGTGLYVSMISAALKSGNPRFSASALRQGRLNLVATQANYSGPAFYVADIKEPDEISGLLFDFDSDLGITESASAISSWVDQKSSVAAVQATAGFKPTLVSAYKNGSDAVYFDGTDDFLQTSGVTVEAQPLTMFFVVYPASDCPVAHSFFDSGNASIAFNIGRSSLSPNTRFNVGASTPLRTDDGYENAKWNLLTAVCATTSSDLRINGVLKKSGDIGTNSLDDITLGAARTGTGGIKGHMVRCLVYDGEVTAANILKIERYLCARYALQRTTIPA